MTCLSEVGVLGSLFQGLGRQHAITNKPPPDYLILSWTAIMVSLEIVFQRQTSGKQ